jgi:hypothetical protein
MKSRLVIFEDCVIAFKEHMKVRWEQTKLLNKANYDPRVCIIDVVIHKSTSSSDSISSIEDMEEALKNYHKYLGTLDKDKYIRIDTELQHDVEGHCNSADDIEVEMVHTTLQTTTVRPMTEQEFIDNYIDVDVNNTLYKRLLSNFIVKLVKKQVNIDYEEWNIKKLEAIHSEIQGPFKRGLIAFDELVSTVIGKH